MNDPLFARWIALWRLGMQDVWRHYTAAQAQILAQGHQLVGQTPAEVIHTEGRARLLHYRPQIDDPHPIPLLCIPSLINRYYVMDLLPERSLVGHLVSQGSDVYMLDWGTANALDRHRTLDEYITGVLRRAVLAVQQASGADRVALLGYCMGGMMAVVYAALYPYDVAAVINLAGPIDYHDDGIYSIWTRAQWLDVDALVDTLGNIPAQLLNYTFNLARPTNELVQAFNYWEGRHDPAFARRFAAMQLWLNDPTPFPGEAFRRYIKDLYQQNHLLRGTFTINGRCIDLQRITIPTLTIAARKDHIAPWRSVVVLDDLIGSTDKTVIVLEGGHIGMVIGSGAHTQLWPQLSTWLTVRTNSHGS